MYRYPDFRKNSGALTWYLLFRPTQHRYSLWKFVFVAREGLKLRETYFGGKRGEGEKMNTRSPACVSESSE